MSTIKPFSTATNSLSSDPLLSSLNLFKTNRKSSSPLIMMGSIGGGLLIELLSGMNRSYSAPNRKTTIKIETTHSSSSTTTTIDSDTIIKSEEQMPSTRVTRRYPINNNSRDKSSTSASNQVKEQQESSTLENSISSSIASSIGSSVPSRVKSFRSPQTKTDKELEEMKQEQVRHKQKWTEIQFMLTSVHEIDDYLIKNKFQLSKEEAIHEFFKMMKFVLAYAEATQFTSSKKMVGMIYSISKNVLKIIGNNPQSLRDVYNLLCMIQFKNFTSMQIPCYQLAYGFKVLNDIEFAQSLFENHIAFILDTLLKSNQSFYCDYLMSAHLLLPTFSITHEHLIDKILELSAQVIPKGALGSSAEEVHEKFHQNKILPSMNSYGLFSCVRSFSEQIFRYMESIEKKTLNDGGFDSELFIKSVRKIHEKGIHMDIHKYNFALEVLVRNNSNKTLEFFNEIRNLEHIKPDTGTYCTLVKHYGKKMTEDDEQNLTTIYEEIKKKNLTNQHLLTTFLSITKRHNHRFDMLREQVSSDLSSMKNLDSHSITELIHQSVLRGGITSGYTFFCSARETARLNGTSLSSSAYNIILHAVSNDLKQITLAFNILNCMLEDKVHPSDFILVSLLSIETKLRDLLYRPGEVDTVIVERLERYKHTLDMLLKDIIDDACQGKPVNYVIISAAMKRFKATKEYGTVIRIWNAVRGTLSQKSKLDGSIYLIALSSCELSGDHKAFNDSLEFLMNENIPRISWQLYYYLISTLVAQKKMKLRDSELYEKIFKFIFNKYTPLVCDAKNVQRIKPAVIEDRWAIPPPTLTSLEIKLLELAKKLQLVQ